MNDMTVIRVLIIEDNPADADLLQIHLEKSETPVTKLVFIRVFV